MDFLQLHAGFIIIITAHFYNLSFKPCSNYWISEGVFSTD